MRYTSFVTPAFCRWNSRSKAGLNKCSSVKMSTEASEEHFDVLQEDGTPTGFSKARSQVHRDGDWHRSTHIWVIAQNGRILVQKRSSLKDTFPVRRSSLAHA